MGRSGSRAWLLLLVSPTACLSPPSAGDGDDTAPPDATPAAVDASTVDAAAPAPDATKVSFALQPMTDSLNMGCSDGETYFTTCPQAGFEGQDGDYDLHEPALVVNGPVAFDPTTGLTWEQEESAGVTFVEAADHCAAQSLALLGGFADWRLPTYHEMVTIFRMSTDGGDAYDQVFDTYDGNELFWSATSVAGTTTDGWGGIGNWPLMGIGTLTAPHLVRCVRGEQFERDWLPGPDGVTVLDPVTGLEWARTPPAGTLVWSEALDHCEGLDLGGHQDWRMPSAKELYTIVDTSADDPALAPAFDLGPSLVFWSASPFAISSYADENYVISFEQGDGLLNVPIDVPRNTRCVRTIDS